MTFLSHCNYKIIPFDSRSVAAFRIVLGVSILYNLIFYRFPAVGVFYNNKTIFPESSIEKYYGNRFSLFQLFDTDLWYYFLFGVLFILSVSFIIGFKTKWVSIIMFFLFGSLISINPYLSHGVEYLIEVALFWSIFLTLNQSFCLLNFKISSFNFGILPHVGFQIQIFLIYFSAWIFKNGETWLNGQVLEVVSYDLIHAKPLLLSLRAAPEILRFLTYFGFYSEFFLSVLLFISIFYSKTKLLAALSLIIIHTLMALLLHVGTFFIVGLAFGMLLLPTSFWNIKLIKQFLGLKERNRNPVALDSNLKNIHIAKKTAIIISILYVTQSSIYQWSKNSFLSPFILSNPIHKYSTGIHFNEPGIFTGLWHQSWKFFSNNIYNDLGDFVFLGYDEHNNIYELRTGSKIEFIESSHSKSFQPLPKTSYFGAEFTFGVYYKFYFDRFPKKTQEFWLEFQLKKYQKKHIDIKIVKAELWKLDRAYHIINNKITIKDSAYKMVTTKNIK